MKLSSSGPMAKKNYQFLDHLNGLHNMIEFTMEKEEGHLPFLGNAIYRITDGLLRHKVYRKPTHTSLYLHQNFHHLPANKQSVSASLIHRTKSLCDHDSLTQEIEFLIPVFKDNGYSHQQIRRAMEPAARTAKTNDKPTSTAYIPYTKITYGRLSKILA
jgi:hypothetical protein